MNDIKNEHIQELFLEDLNSSNVNFEVSEVLDNLSFFQCDPSDLKQIFAFNSLKESLNNALLAKFGDLLNKFWLHSGKSKESFLNMLVCEANSLLLKQYRDILTDCGCPVCIAGAKAEPVKCILSCKNFCFKVNHEVDSLKGQFTNYSFRSFKRYSDLALNLNKSISSSSAFSSLYSFRFCDMKDSDFLDVMSTSLVRCAFDSLALENNNLLFENVSQSSPFRDWDEFNIDDKSSMKWSDGDSFIYQGKSYRIYGIDSPEIGSVVTVKRYNMPLREGTDPKACGTYHICSYPGINAWEHLNYLMQTCESVKVVRSPSETEQGRYLCTVKFMYNQQELDYGLSTLTEGLSFLYPCFSLLVEYSTASAKAKESKIGLFCLPKDALFALLPWKYRPLHSEHNSCVEDLIAKSGNMTSYSVFCLPYSCESSIHKLGDFPICCSNHYKEKHSSLTVKQSKIKGAGFGIYNNGPLINVGEYICLYSELTTDVLKLQDNNYIFKHRKAEFDGSYVKYHKGPLINDQTINRLADRLQQICENSGPNILNDAKYLLEGEGVIKLEGESANAKFVVLPKYKICYIQATQPINTGSEIYLSYGIKNYWYVLLNEYLSREKNNSALTPLEKTFKVFETAIESHSFILAHLKAT